MDDRWYSKEVAEMYGGFSRTAHTGESPAPQPSSALCAEILKAIHAEADADSFIGVLGGILQRHGFELEARKVLHYPSVFCPCEHHVRAPWASSKSSW